MDSLDLNFSLSNFVHSNVHAAASGSSHSLLKQTNRNKRDRSELENENENGNASQKLTAAKKKKRKEYYIRANPLPRILKRDIRREYPHMFINVHNHCDSFLTNRFFHELCAPNCSFLLNVPMAAQFNAPPVRLYKGVADIIRNMVHCFDVLPDKIVKMLEIPNHALYHSQRTPMNHQPDNAKIPHVQIIQREQVPGCEIKFFTQMQSTILYQDAFHPYTPALPDRDTDSPSLPCSPCSRSVSSSSLSSFSSDCTSGDSDDTDADAMSHGLDLHASVHIAHAEECIYCRNMRQHLMSPPVALTCFSKVTLLLDEHHRIYSIAIESD